MPRPDEATSPARRRTSPRHRAHLDVATRTRHPRRSLVLLSALSVLAAGVPSALAVAGGSKTVSAKTVSELVVNGDFERGTTGWRTNGARQVLDTARTSASGESAARLSRARVGRVILNDARPTVSRATQGRTYSVSARVRSSARRVEGKLRVREMSSGDVVSAHRIPFVATSGTWTRVSLRVRTRNEGVALDLSVVGRKLPADLALLVDDVSMVEQPVATAPAPSGPFPCVSDPMGIPTEGTYLGAAVGGTSVLSDRERQLGTTLALHRTYYQADQIDRAVRMATEDLAAGRLPWISFKPPLSWAEMAAGDGNAWAAELGDALAGVPGPVWLAVHHEPETDGDMDLWTQMQTQVAPIIHARTDNVAYSVIYASWHTYSRGQDNVATKWPGDEHVDILAADAYNPYGAVRDGSMVTASLDIKSYYEKMAAWAEAHGTAWAIGETGQTPTGAQVDPTWLDRAYHDMVAMGGAGLSWFDSSRNSDADWTLDDPTKFNAFKTLLPESVRFCPAP